MKLHTIIWILAIAALFGYGLYSFFFNNEWYGVNQGAILMGFAVLIGLVWFLNRKTV